MHRSPLTYIKLKPARGAMESLQKTQHSIQRIEKKTLMGNCTQRPSWSKELPLTAKSKKFGNLCLRAVNSLVINKIFFHVCVQRIAFLAINVVLNY